MGRTRTQLRTATARELGLPFVSGTATANTNTTVTHVNNFGRYSDDELIGMYLYLSAATPVTRRITDNVQSSGVVTFIPSATSDTGYELLPFPAESIHEAIDNALMMLYDEGILVRKVKLMGVTGSPIYNGFPEYWTSSSALHGWTAATFTLTRRSGGNYGWVSETVCDISASTGTLLLDAVWARFLADLAKSSISLYGWLTVSNANHTRLQIIQDDGTLNSTTYHSGDGEWEMVYVESVNLPDTDTQWSVRVQNSLGNVSPTYGGMWITGGFTPSLHPLPIALLPHGPTTVRIGPLATDTPNTRANVMLQNAQSVHGWDWVMWHDEAADDETGCLLWRQKPAAGRLMLIEGDAPFTLPTADAGVVELNQIEGLLVAKTAALILLQNNVVTGDARWAQRIAMLQRDIERLAKGAGRSADVATLGPNW